MSDMSTAFPGDPSAGRELAPGLRLIRAPNPSPMTYTGTNTYVLGQSDLAVIDPGPDSPAHLAAILAAAGQGRRISHIIVTHAHKDHSSLAGALARETGAPIYAFGDATAGRSAIMTALASQGLAGGGEGLDLGFSPDVALADGAVVEGAGWRLEALHTPGHIGNHLCLAWNDVCFSGDHVMGWASSVVSPPDGDITDFMASCRKLQSRQWRVFYPGHGDPIPDPSARLSWLIEHRLKREAEILNALREGPMTAQALAEQIYVDAPAKLLPMAARNVFAHLVDLKQKNRVSPLGVLSETAAFRLD